MRTMRFAAVVAAVFVPVSVVHGEPACCDAPLPTIVYGQPPLPYVPPPSGYLLDPSDSRGPIYVVNQGPVYDGPAIYGYSGSYNYVVPTYSEGGYAYTEPYPYVHGWSHAYTSWRDAAPYVGSEIDAHLVRDITVIAGSGRPYGPHPRYAYRYRPAPSARVIRAPRGY